MRSRRSRVLQRGCDDGAVVMCRWNLLCRILAFLHLLSGRLLPAGYRCNELCNIARGILVPRHGDVRNFRYFSLRCYASIIESDLTLFNKKNRALRYREVF